VEKFASPKVVNYPQIQPVVTDTDRPFWSIMIPTYNPSADYLAETLKSILRQDLCFQNIQIEVIDDCSTHRDAESIVQSVGQGRVSFFRNSQNLGLVGNWNACIQRAKGHWVHILHQDDIVLPDFYQHLQAGMNTQVGAAFSRHVCIDAEGHWQTISALERSTHGILENWLEKIAVAQQLQFPSIVVKRSVYEHLGGFCAEAHYAADWEMWKRIAVNFPIWYEPNILACYRFHPDSETCRLLQTAQDIADVRRAIEISSPYLPPEQAAQLSNQACKNCAYFALRTAREMLEKSDWGGATAQIREAWRCHQSLGLLYHTLPLLKLLSHRWIMPAASSKN
jgi:glycosyltransferase involved in cell wall biosynthesis